MKEEVCVIVIPTPEFIHKVVEVPSAKEEEKINNVFKEIADIANATVDYIMKSLYGEEKSKKEKKKQEKKCTAEKSIHYSTAELAKKLGCLNKNVSNIIKKFNERRTDGYIECPGAGTKNIGYSAEESTWTALFNWRKITKRS